eukprot:239864_1
MAVSMWLLLFSVLHLFHLSIGTNSGIGKSVLLTEAAQKYGAVCLDGTPGNIYISEGSEQTKYVFFFQGGGWCWNESGCWTRRNESLGSTKNDAATHNLNKVGFLGNDSTTSPLMYNWNKVFVRYCDGMSYAGDVTDPVVNPKNSSELMYYRGKRILNAVFESLLSDYGLDKATDVVVGGGSAGGLATFLHTNYIAENFINLNKTKYVSLPDVGFFIEYNGYNGMTQWANKMRYIYKMQNISTSIYDPKCFDKAWNDSECVFAQNIAGDNLVPTFILNSQYDQYQAQSILGTATSNATLLNEYGQNFTRILINNYLDKNKVSGNIYGAYIDGCYHHAAGNPIYWSGLNIDGFTQATAFMQFYNNLGKENNQLFWYQNVTYPCDACCPPNSTDYFSYWG